MTEYILPLIMGSVALITLLKQENSYGAMLSGCKSGMQLAVSILPSLILLLSAVSMLQASGFIDYATELFSPLFGAVGIPPELLPLMLIRPFSGSAALAICADLILSYGPDSMIGRTAAVMMGATETTFYTISVYLGACGISKSGYIIPAAMIADFVGFLSAAWIVPYYYG